MKQYNKFSYEDEINKTEAIVKGLFNNFFYDDNYERLKDELEIKITKWKKDLNIYINDNNPYKENKIELDISIKKYIQNTEITKNDILNDLYNIKLLSNNIDISFWENKLNNGYDLKILKNNINDIWVKNYNEKNDDWIFNILKQKRYKFITDIESWINLLKKLKYMSNMLRIKTGVLWDFKVGELEEHDINLLKRWVDFINDCKDIEIICDSMGRRVDAEKSLKNIEFKNTYRGTNKKISSKEDIEGIYFAKDIENVIPEELLLLCNEESEKLFKLKYIENKLMCFDKSAYVFNNNIECIVRAGYKDGRGDMIICIDTSGSMKGINEYIAKAVMFKMVMQALSENRNAYLINFSTEIHTCKFTKENGIEDLIKFLKLSYHGGSDIYKALYEANRMMNTYNFINADVLVLSDFIMEDIPSNLIAMCSKQKNKGSRYFALSIGHFPFGYSYRKVFNRHWIFDADTGLKTIY